MAKSQALTQIRIIFCLFSIALIASGLTAIFAREGLQLLYPLFSAGSILDRLWPSMAEWLNTVYLAVEATYTTYPFLAYGYDWLAFGHFIISIPFIMAIRDPIRLPWVVEYGIAACIAVFPFAIVFGAIRGIPVFWRLVDTIFGIGGLVLLAILRNRFKLLSVYQDAVN
ncbi:MAG: hypothetical protein GTO14_05640 [Anaerolineales bacterium]|nr:hypothetical protein [Anaerolineales bacterium]